jgi:23S rRNA G2069 N7-methylase RlmK/C1962 C5-methylase RlmI
MTSWVDLPARRAAAQTRCPDEITLDAVLSSSSASRSRALRGRARQYDLIALDPPKLASAAAQLDKATRAYKDLNLLAIKLLAPGGVLLRFSCSAAMTMELFQKVVAGAALDARRDVRVPRPETRRSERLSASSKRR